MARLDLLWSDSIALTIVRKRFFVFVGFPIGCPNDLEMFSWLQKDIPIGASVFFRGTWPCTKESFLPLHERGIQTTEGVSNDGIIWSLELNHQTRALRFLREAIAKTKGLPSNA
jgi:hypothetical protein